MPVLMVDGHLTPGLYSVVLRQRDSLIVLCSAVRVVVEEVDTCNARK
jgi:hypothetical protein